MCLELGLRPHHFAELYAMPLGTLARSARRMSLSICVTSSTHGRHGGLFSDWVAHCLFALKAALHFHLSTSLQRAFSQTRQ